MRRGKKWMAYLLAGAMASVTVAGCQGSQKAGESSAVWTREAEENSKARGEDALEEGGSQGKAQGGSGGMEKDEEWMKNQNFVKGSTREAKDPEKADISPEDYESWNRLMAEKEISQAFARGLDEFAYKSGSAVLKDGRGNGNYSPLSLYYTLALAGCGTRGETARQILENLGVESRKELAEQCSRLYQWYVYRNQKEKEQMEHYGMEGYQSTIRLGNSLWISDQLAVGEAYQKLAAEKFFASSYGVDFGDPDTGKRMGKWIAEKTGGVLEPELTMDPGTRLAILNTLYFYGGWAEPFSEEMTREDVFHLAEGGEIRVPYLNRTEMMGAFKKGEGYTLSYLGTDNNCRMVFLLPEEGRSPEEFLESPESLRNALEVKEEDWTAGKVIWKVPKFDFGSSYQLNDTLMAMGMDGMFRNQTDFGDISPEPLTVSSVIQETHIGVDEMGVEGAAYTMMALARGAMIEEEETAEMILDRPFLFGIRDDSQGVWLFLGVCRNPAEKEGEQVENDIFLTSAPEIRLTDTLSGTRNEFPVTSGNYTWNRKEQEEMVSAVACGRHPLDAAWEGRKVLKIPDYNGQEEVGYLFCSPVMPEKITLREWDVSQIGKEDAKKPLETVYEDTGLLLFKHDKVYEIVAEWQEEALKRRGFFGEASYVVVTD